jgi:UDP-3-O-[3-hydroxymyristoyl] glucosamine N-acyltransferase
VILSELARQLGCELRGDGDVEVVGVAPLGTAGPGELSFATGNKYAELLAATRASAVIRPASLDSPLPSLLSDNPYLTFARTVPLLHPPERLAAGVHPSAIVDPAARLGADVHVGPLAVVGPGASVGARTIIHAHVTVYAGAEIGEDCVLHSGVQVREGCVLGARVVIQNGAVIGGDGFGFARDAKGRYEKIQHLGRVVIEDDVEMGALSAVDRASLGETRIGRGTKIDNLVQIGHSVSIGPDTVLAGQVGIAGSTKLGARVTLAGQVGVAGHLEIGDDVIATAKTGVPHSVPSGRRISGYPAIDNRAWLKSSAVFAKLPELQRRLRALERKLADPSSDDPSEP